MALRHQNVFPVARSADLVTETVEDEILVYDRRSKEAHRLSPLAAAVFASSDGHHSIADITRAARDRLGETVDIARVEQALAELEARDLIAVKDAEGVSRRAFLRKGALAAGATAAAAAAAAGGPFVASVGTPAYGAVASPPLSSLSFVAAAFQCGSTVYWMKWPMEDSANGLPSGDPECGGTMSLVCATMSPAATTNACLAGATVQEQLFTHQVTFTFPSDCKLVDFVLKCGSDCIKPGQGGNAALPAGGVSGPTYTTAGC